ncbi:MAG: TonB-dependent receptor [Candidatus Cloacimonadales bacterium]|nr:TonB-dependent receptor [Candidatus Cloacimonadales bacterium]
MQRKILFLLIATMLISTSLFAGTTGKLAGKVTDDKGNAIPFAQIVLEGPEIGAETKENGYYIIINIPPGDYTVACMRQSFQTQKSTGVKINLDLTTIQNFTLVTQAVEIIGIKVTEAVVDKVQPTKTGSGLSISAESIENVAVTDLAGIIAIQPGVSITNGEVHFRGGRGNEVSYTVDGMSVSDPVDGGAALTVDMDAVAFTDVKTGGFTAEYGNAQSGIVNIITRSGSDVYTGKIEGISDHLIPDSYNSNEDEIKFTLGGPVLGPIAPSLKNKFTFFVNGSGSWYDGRYYKEYKNDPVEELKYLTIQNFEPNDPYAGRKDFIGFDRGNRNYNDYNANAKFKYEINKLANLTFSVRGDKSIWKPFNYSWKYSLDHYQALENNQIQYAMTYDHTFNSQTNLKVKASYYHKDIVRGPIGLNLDDFFVLDEANFDSLATNDMNECTGIDYLTDLDNPGVIGDERIYDWTITSDGIEKELSKYTNFVRPGSIFGFFQDDENSIFNLRTDFEYQLNQIHGFKTGFELIKHNIKKNQVTSPWVLDKTRYDRYLSNATPTYWFYDFSTANADSIDIYVNRYDLDIKPNSTVYYTNTAPGDELINKYFKANTYNLDDYYAATKAASGNTDGYEANPIQGAFYLQDKMEWEGMIVNAGLRFDFWYLGERYKIIRDGGIASWEDFDKDERFQMMVSPRLGVSHPISETAVMHFAYNYQNQLPQMQYIFTTQTWEDAITSNQNIVVGTPDLKPQITVTYEVGLQKSFGDYYVMDIQAYYKNIYNYVSTKEVADTSDSNVTWYKYISEDYGSARGIDLNLERSLYGNIMGSVSYSLAWANGNNSDTVIQTETTNLREFPLDWDMRHNFSLSLTFTVPKDEDFTIPFTDITTPKFITDDFSMNFFYNIASGTPYTPTTQENRPMDTNSKLKPFTENANFRVSKKIWLNDKTNFKAYFLVENLFNRRNVYGVYSYTGSPYYDGANISEPNINPPYTAEEVQYVHDLSTMNPGNVSQGRTYTFGVSFNF